MTQDERWIARYNEMMGSLEEKHRNPSKLVGKKERGDGYLFHE